MTRDGVASRRANVTSPETAGLVAELERLQIRLADAERERAALAAELATARMRSDAILESAIDYAIVTADLDGRVTSWNSGASLILGWSAAEMLGQPIELFFTPEDRAAEQPLTEMREARDRGSAPDMRWHLRKDGGRFWASGMMMPLKLGNGELVGYLKILRDRTQDRLNELALGASEMRFRSLIEVSPQVVWFGDVSGAVTYCNAFWYGYTGFTPEQTEGEGWLAAVHPEHRERVRSVWAQAVAAGDGYEVEMPLRRHQDGHYRWFLARGVPMRNGQNEIEGWIGIALDIHERKNAEQHLRALTELAPAIIWFGNPDGTLSYLNDRWYEFTGQTPEQALPTGWADVVHPGDSAGLAQAWADARAHGALYDTQARLRRRDGEYRWFLIRAEPLRGDNGEVTGWLGSNSDIHDGKAAEEALHRAQDQLRLAVEATDIGIYDHDLSTGELGWDARTKALFGLSPEAAVTYETFLAGLHPDDRDRVHRAVEATLPPGNGLYDVEYRTIGLEDGVERWIAARGRMITAEGRAGRLVGTVRDITAEKRAADSLREAEERYRLAAQATNDAIWDWDLTTGRINWNEAICTLFGYAPEEVGTAALWWTSKVHPEDRDHVLRSIQNVIDGIGEHWADEYRFRRADGTDAYIFDRGYVIRDESGRAVRMIGAMLDITQRKRAEEHQKLLTSELQHRVKNTLALVQAIASQTFRHATDMDVARDAFSARLVSLGRAHDILTQSSWTAAPIHDVLSGSLKAHRLSGSTRIHIDGPNVLMAAKPALSLALAIHELATNAAKYGALSNDGGVVDLSWQLVPGEDGQRFILTWAERDGPTVAPPARKGFGSRLIERSFATEVGGVVRLTYEPSGVIWQVEAPLASIQDQSDDGAS